MVLFVLFASGPGLSFSLALQQTSTPTNTASPTTQYQIQFVNPSGQGLSEELSTKSDGVDEKYHLVAWVNQVPPNASVEFRYFDPSQNKEVLIATGTQTGIPDTFDTFWAIPSTLSDTNITIYAVLFSGGQEVDRDTESDIVLNNRDPGTPPPAPTPGPASEARAETIEITSPANGGAWGLFTPRDRPTAGLINVSMSSGITFVRAVYSVTPPGEEPSWITCGTESRSAAANGVRCTLQSQHRGTDVTAVGVVSNDTQPNPVTGANSYAAANDDSSDAHRVAQYEQRPERLLLDESTQDGATAGGCSRVFTATLQDQFGFPLANANLDVHAQGPVDEIAFDDGTTASSNQAPQTGHGNEAARRCSANPPTSSGSQGDHDNPTGNDIKHIESVGTDDAGQWRFQLYSPAVGTTQFTIWSDLDNDDQHCTTEVSANGAVGFGQTTGGVTGVAAEESTCPSPSPTTPAPGPTTPTATPSESPTEDPRGCTHQGSEGAEEIEGTPGDDVICAYGGNDIIRGLGGDDVIYGDEGRDDVTGGAGADEIFGGGDKDTLRGSGGNDELLGEDDNDILTGGGGRDSIDGGHGIDTIRGSGGGDLLEGGQAGDNMTGGNGRDVLLGGAGRDVLDGGRDRDRCVGGRDKDTFRSCEQRQS